MHHPVLQSWLSLQSKSLGPTRAASARLQSTCLPEKSPPTRQSVDGQLDSSAPDDWFASLGTDVQDAQVLDDLLAVAINSRAVVVATPDIDDKGDRVLRIAQPIAVQGSVCGAVAVELAYEGAGHQDKAVRLLQWGAAWLDLLLTHSSGSHDNASARWQMAWHQELPELLQSVAAHESLQQTLMAVTGFLAHRLGLEYVAIGLRRGDVFKVDALSDNAAVSQQSSIAERLSEQMRQTYADVVQHNAVQESDEDAPTAGCFVLDNGSIGVPFVDNHDVYAVLIAQPRDDEPTTPALIEAISLSARLLGPIVAIKKRQQQNLLARGKQRLARQQQRLATRRGVVRLGLIGAALLVGLILLATDIPYRVSGDARVEGAVQRAVIAPFDGFVEQAHVRAGERVSQGELLAELDDTELRLTLRQLQGDKAQTSKEYRQALAGFDKSRSKILEAQLEQSSARIDQIQQQLNRTQLRAPFAGTVVSGDLSRSLGKPVQRGEILFEVAPLNEYRVAITIKDRDIADVAPEQAGSLVLAALASRELTIVVKNIAQLPDDEQHPGAFRVEAHLAGEVDVLRPGMRGIAKIQTTERARWKVWSHSLTEWFRYQIWQWLP